MQVLTSSNTVAAAVVNQDAVLCRCGCSSASQPGAGQLLHSRFARSARAAHIGGCCRLSSSATGCLQAGMARRRCSSGRLTESRCCCTGIRLRAASLEPSRSSGTAGIWAGPPVLLPPPAQQQQPPMLSGLACPGGGASATASRARRQQRAAALAGGCRGEAARGSGARSSCCNTCPSCNDVVGHMRCPEHCSVSRQGARRRRHAAQAQQHHVLKMRRCQSRGSFCNAAGSRYAVPAGQFVLLAGAVSCAATAMLPAFSQGLRALAVANVGGAPAALRLSR